VSPRIGGVLSRFSELRQHARILRKTRRTSGCRYVGVPVVVRDDGSRDSMVDIEIQTRSMGSLRGRGGLLGVSRSLGARPVVDVPQLEQLVESPFRDGSM